MNNNPNKLHQIQQILRHSCLSATFLLFLPYGVIAQTPVDAAGTEFPERLTLETLKPEEIFSSNTGTATSQAELLAPAPFQDSIIRNFEWTRQVPLDQLPTPVRVTYSLKGNNDQADKFSDQSSPTSIINAALRNQRSEILFRDSDRNIAIIQGSVEFVLDPSQARAGRHAGKLSICILSRSGTCL